MDEMELVAFEIISNVGMAKSSCIEAIREGRQGKYDEAYAKLEEAKEFLSHAHHAHMGLIQKEASGEKVQISLILMHAEDQFLTTETLKDLAVEMIEMHRGLSAK